MQNSIPWNTNETPVNLLYKPYFIWSSINDVTVEGVKDFVTIVEKPVSTRRPQSAHFFAAKTHNNGYRGPPVRKCKVDLKILR